MALCSGTKISVEKHVSDFMITLDKAFALGIVIYELFILKDNSMGYDDRVLRVVSRHSR